MEKASAVLIQIGIFSTRWNVVIGGQLFSKSFHGLTTYKMEVMGLEGLMTALVLLLLPLVILAVLTRLLPLGPEKETASLPLSPGPATRNPTAPVCGPRSRHHRRCIGRGGPASSPVRLPQARRASGPSSEWSAFLYSSRAYWKRVSPRSLAMTA